MLGAPHSQNSNLQIAASSSAHENSMSIGLSLYDAHIDIPWVPDGFRGALCTETPDGLTRIAELCLGEGVARGRPAVQLELLQDDPQARPHPGDTFFSIRPGFFDTADGTLKMIE